MGTSLNPKNIKEGDDVYFECNVRANPRAYRLTWFHEVLLFFLSFFLSHFSHPRFPLIEGEG